MITLLVFLLALCGPIHHYGGADTLNEGWIDGHTMEPGGTEP